MPSMPSQTPHLLYSERSRYQFYDPAFSVSDVQTGDKSEICEAGQARKRIFKKDPSQDENEEGQGETKSRL
jgi:hypothetical protein